MPELQTGHGQANQEGEETEGAHLGVGRPVKLLHLFLPVKNATRAAHVQGFLLSPMVTARQ